MDEVKDFDLRTGEVVRKKLRLVVLESPYGADTDGQIRANIDYARMCVRDCLRRGESPIASHLLLTQPNILDDRVPEDRRLGMEAGWAWIAVADMVVVYTDYGISGGMHAGIDQAQTLGVPVEYRALAEDAKHWTA